MKAVTYTRYTTPVGLTLSEVLTPTVAPDQVLIKVAAASINPLDWHQYRGDPTFMRLTIGLRVKAPRTVGSDLAGTVAEVGSDVTRFAVGDRVLAEPCQGACAEYVAIGADAVAKIADKVDFRVAAAAPMGALTALQALRDSAALRPGDRVLVWGASGGVGHLAIQVARALGASAVDAVCSARNADMVRAQGADQVFDYATQTVSTDQPYDVIFDTVSTQGVRTLAPLLKPGGRIVTVGAIGGGRLLGPLGGMVRRLVVAKARRVKASLMMASGSPTDFGIIAGWLADGTLTPVIQREYALDQTAEACRELEAGHVAGKLVISVP